MFTERFNIPIKDGHIDSTIHKPPEAKSIVLISDPPGSGRFNKRNKRLTKQLDNAGLATLLCDWNQIKAIHQKKGDFNHLKMAQSLSSIIQWMKSHKNFKDLEPILYSSGTGAAFSMIAAAELKNIVKAVVSRNGRLEFAEDYLDRVKTPTLIAVGEKDYRLLEMNKKAYKKLECPKQFVVVPGITPFFEKPKKMERLGQMSIEWIKKNTMPLTESQSVNQV